MTDSHRHETDGLWAAYAAGGLDIVERRRAHDAAEQCPQCAAALAAARQARREREADESADEPNWCLSEATLLSHHYAELNDEDAADIAEHLAACELCQHVARVVAEEAALKAAADAQVEAPVLRAPRPAAKPMRAPRPAQKRRGLRPQRRMALAAAATVILVAGYAGWRFTAAGADALTYRLRTLTAPTGQLARPTPSGDLGQADVVVLAADETLELQIELPGGAGDAGQIEIIVTPPTGDPSSVRADVPVEPGENFEPLEPAAFEAQMRRELGAVRLRLRRLPPLSGEEAARVNVRLVSPGGGCQGSREAALEVEIHAPSTGASLDPLLAPVRHAAAQSEDADPGSSHCLYELAWAVDQRLGTRPSDQTALRDAWQHFIASHQPEAARLYADALIAELAWTRSAVARIEPMLDVIYAQLVAESDAAPTDLAHTSVFPMALALLWPALRTGDEGALARLARFGLVRVSNLRQQAKVAADPATQARARAEAEAVLDELEPKLKAADSDCSRTPWARIRGWVHYNRADLALDAGLRDLAERGIKESRQCFAGYATAEPRAAVANLQSSALRLRALIHLDAGRHADAIADAEAAAQLAERDSSKRFAHAVAAHVHRVGGRSAEAFSHAQVAAEALVQALDGAADPIAREALLGKRQHVWALEVYFDGVGSRDPDAQAAFELMERLRMTPPTVRGEGEPSLAGDKRGALVERLRDVVASLSEASPDRRLTFAEPWCEPGVPSPSAPEPLPAVEPNTSLVLLAPIGDSVVALRIAPDSTHSIWLGLTASALSATGEAARVELASGEPYPGPAVRALADALEPLAHAVRGDGTFALAPWGPWLSMPYAAVPYGATTWGEVQTFFVSSTAAHAARALRALPSAPSEDAAIAALVSNDPTSFALAAQGELDRLGQAVRGHATITAAPSWAIASVTSAQALHIRGHGWVARGGPAAGPLAARPRPAVCVARCQDEDPELVRPADIAGAAQRWPWVTLGVCSAAVGTPLPLSGAAISLTTAFLDAGSRAVVAPLWPVDESFAQRWVAEVYQEAFSGRELCDAHRDVAARWRRRGEPAARWAAFTCLGR